MTRSTWSGGVTWSGTGKWMPDGASGTGRPRPEVAIAGALRTGLQSATWSLGPRDILSDLSPGTCSLSFAGVVTAAPGDSIVISATPGTLWVGRVDTCSTTWDEASNAWTTISGTDPLGALGEAGLDGDSESGSSHDLEDQAEYWASVVGVELDVVDDSVSGLPNKVPLSPPLSGNVLPLMNSLARDSNAVMALHRDGKVHAIIREAVTPSDQVDVSDRFRDWTEEISIAVDINRWSAGGVGSFGEDAADIAIYGQRTYLVDLSVWTPGTSQFADWIAYGGSQRPLVKATFPIASWSDDDLMLLDPFDWITRDAADWQVMSVSHSVDASSWSVTITADNLLSLL